MQEVRKAWALVAPDTQAIEALAIFGPSVQAKPIGTRQLQKLVINWVGAKQVLEAQPAKLGKRVSPA